jgi:hypothetical protein
VAVGLTVLAAMVSMFVLVIMMMRLFVHTYHLLSAGQRDGVRHVLQVLVTGPLRLTGDDFAKDIPFDGGYLFCKATGVLEESGDLPGILPIHIPRARVQVGPALGLRAARVDP